ncbi:ECF transporter S component [Vagococcus sp. PNs007]|uniref:ECF transporter S component n=1 Tax=Vagococcus proximus TaxID=2991417 RepID=A0ABT5X0G2_9ENTE|nr:ECF transporter S component [Vagococcus proximus]MDF0479469.1 ECF transporter S component [Vagococcus proximus]
MTSQTKKTIATNDIVLIALFATLTIIGTMIRIPVPSAFGAPFIHLGNSVLLLSVLLLGYKKGALAGGMGFAIFDLLNGFPLEAPYFFIESFIVGGVAILIFNTLKTKKESILTIILTATGAGIAKIIMTFLKNWTMSFIMTSNSKTALVSAIGSLPATLVNTVSTVIIVTLIYPSLKKLTQSFYKKTSL